MSINELIIQTIFFEKDFGFLIYCYFR